MKPSVLRKADRIAKARAPKPRMHFFWWDLRETRAMVRARIRATIASGEASPNDRFVICTWTREEGDGAGDPPGGEQPGSASAPQLDSADREGSRLPLEVSRMRSAMDRKPG